MRFGELRAVDKIRVGTNQVGTDVSMVLDGLRDRESAVSPDGPGGLRLDGMVIAGTR